MRTTVPFSELVPLDKFFFADRLHVKIHPVAIADGQYYNAYDASARKLAKVPRSILVMYVPGLLQADVKVIIFKQRRIFLLAPGYREVGSEKDITGILVSGQGVIHDPLPMPIFTSTPDAQMDVLAPPRIRFNYRPSRLRARQLEPQRL